MAKMSITDISEREAEISYTDVYTGGTITRRYYYPIGGGYVRERGGQGGQVCRRLAGTGDTLICKDGERLASVLRREYRAMRRAERAR